jgi:glutaconate CoA-transferase, subunit B
VSGAEHRTTASPLELDAVLVARMLRDGDRVLIGAGLDAPRAGALLAALTHAPGLAVCQALAWIDVTAVSSPVPPRPGMDLRDADGAEALLRDYEAYDDVRRLSTFFVVGGFEISRFGATNLLGRFRDGRWLRRGPGAIGTTSMAVVAERTMVYATRHEPSVFLERCDVASTHGWSPQDDGAPHGPSLCLSPAGVFDFPPPRREMRLRHTRPGWTPERVQEATGFPLAGLSQATPVRTPTPGELEVLRERVDPTGRLR